MAAWPSPRYDETQKLKAKSSERKARVEARRKERKHEKRVAARGGSNLAEVHRSRPAARAARPLLLTAAMHS